MAPPVGALEWLAADDGFWAAPELCSCCVVPGLVLLLVPGWYLTMIGVGAQPPSRHPESMRHFKKAVGLYLCWTSVERVAHLITSLFSLL